MLCIRRASISPPSDAKDLCHSKNSFFVFFATPDPLNEARILVQTVSSYKIYFLRYGDRANGLYHISNTGISSGAKGFSDRTFGSERLIPQYITTKWLLPRLCFQFSFFAGSGCFSRFLCFFEDHFQV